MMYLMYLMYLTYMMHMIWCICMQKFNWLRINNFFELLRISPISDATSGPQLQHCWACREGRFRRVLCFFESFQLKTHWMEWVWMSPRMIQSAHWIDNATMHMLPRCYVELLAKLFWQCSDLLSVFQFQAPKKLLSILNSRQFRVLIRVCQALDTVTNATV